MKKEELKKLIKPLIKECLKEVLIEEGFTKMLSEAAIPSNIEKKNVEQAPVVKQLRTEAAQQNKQTIAEARKKMLDEISMGGFDAFAGTAPLKDGGSATEPAVPVTGMLRGDPGVDISRLMSGKMKATMNALSGKKVKE